MKERSKDGLTMGQFHFLGVLHRFITTHPDLFGAPAKMQPQLELIDSVIVVGNFGQVRRYATILGYPDQTRIPVSISMVFFGASWYPMKIDWWIGYEKDSERSFIFEETRVHCTACDFNLTALEAQGDSRLADVCVCPKCGEGLTIQS